MKKQALVTGATSGIGRATALRLAAEGYDIIATGRRSERLESLRREIEAAGGRCTTLTFDVRSEEAVRRNLEPLGRVDLLVNNAGLAAGLEHIDKGDTADWDAMIDTNVKGLLYVTRVITPQDGGRRRRARLQHRVDRRHGTLRERRRILRFEARRARHLAGHARRPARQRHQGDGDPSGHGRDGVLRGALPRRQGARRPGLRRRRAAHRRRHRRGDRMGGTITGPYDR